VSDVLAVRDLTTGFGATQVLHGVDLSVPAGGSAVLLGLNGAGKSVALKAISGLVRAWSGSIVLNGRELVALDPEDRVRAGIGHVLQAKGVFPYLSVAENLRLGAAVRARHHAANLERVYAIYPRLAQRPRQQAGSLSGGEQAMLAVARALMAEPNVLLIDEPSAGLSPRMVGELGATLAAVRASGTALLIVEQNVGFGLELADDVFVLEKGRVAYHHAAARLDRDRVATLLGMGDLLAPARKARKTAANNTAPAKKKATAKKKKAAASA
jgi:branched-chain amino acid transport system ATP-binding protein